MRDGDVWTSAGVTAGMDLALALVEDDLDREAALTIARHLVLFLRRPGNQSQFSATLAAQQPEREPLREVQRLVARAPRRRSLRRGDGRARAHERRATSRARSRAETGVTPARYVERVRLEAARRRLEDSAEPVAAIAAACGFGTAETMRRVFLRALGVGPAEYRRRFHTNHTGGTEMNIAILLYDRFTALDAIGPYEVLSRLPGAQVDVRRRASAGPVRTDNGMLTLIAERSLAELAAPDIVLVPGGPGEVAAARRRAGARLAARGARDEHAGRRRCAPAR